MRTSSYILISRKNIKERKMKVMRLISVVLLSLLMIVVSLSGCTSSTPTTTSPAATTAAPQTAKLQIGALETLSGPMSAIFARQADAMVAAADWINSNGGVKVGNTTYNIEIVAVDDAGSPDGAVAGANKLVYDKGVKYIVVGPMPEMTIPSGQITEKEKVLRIKMGYLATKGELTDYTFASHSEVPFFDMFFQKFIADYPSVKKIALVAPSDQAGLYLRDLEKAAVQKVGLAVTAEESFEGMTTDFYPLVTKLLASKPDAIAISVGISPWFGGILKQARELGFKGPILTPTNTGDIQLVKNIAGASATDFYALDYDVTNPAMPEMVKTIGGIIQTKYKTDLTVDHLFGWEAIWDIAQAVEKAQSIDTTKVRDTLRTMTDIKTPFGTGFTGGAKTFGLNNVIVRPEPICRIMNGQITIGEWLKPTLP
jgi:branched-chain amino acid transport system substrate-binding protein